MRVLRNAAAAATIVALGTIVATSSAQAALQTLTVNIDQYASAVDHTPGEILATVTIADLAAGGVNVDLSLDKAIYFASTGGPHVTFAFNLDKSISFKDLTFSNPLKSDFTFGFNKDNKDLGTTFGTFTDGLNGTWKGTNNHFAGPIDFDIAGVSVSDFLQNAKNDWALIALAVGPQPIRLIQRYAEPLRHGRACPGHPRSVSAICELSTIYVTLSLA
jgi:hypothetical protein